MALAPVPTRIHLHRASRVLDVEFDDGLKYSLPVEYLRVFSPSAEVRGHGGPMALVTGKRQVNVDRVEPVGNYAVRLVFDDGHATGIFSWSVLATLGKEFDRNWDDYLRRVEKAGASRD